MSPELGTKVVESGDTVAQNIPYEIVNVEEVTTEVSFYKGIRVEMLTAKGEIGSIMLWRRAVTGTGSKLGVFITLLGSNTDMWLHQWVIFKNWEKNNRVILPFTPPAVVPTDEEATKAYKEAIGKPVKSKSK